MLLSLALLSAAALGSLPQDESKYLRRISDPTGFTATVDLRTQRLHLDVPIERDFGRTAGELEEHIHAHLSGHLQKHARFVGAAELGMKAKLFDDALMAAVELAAQRGCGEFHSKTKLLEACARQALGATDVEPGSALAGLLAAQAAGAEPLALDAVAASARQAALATFLADEKRSKPLGIYTRNAEFERIFRQDRLLQAGFDPKQWSGVIAALQSDATLRSAYERWLLLARGLTNDFVQPDLMGVLKGDSIGPAGAAFLPASRSYEGDLVKQLFAGRSVPADFDLAGALIEGVQTGKVKLAPRAQSGWYDYQVHALEPLAIPERMVEAQRLVYSPRYRAELVQLLKGLLALSRETHVKQLELPSVGAAAPQLRLSIAPDLRVEPLPTHYVRRAKAYAFVARHLERSFGTEALGSIHAEREEGASLQSLAQELPWMEQLFRGAALCACEDLGLEPQQVDPALVADAAALEVFLNWSKGRRDDADLGADVRMMVPVFYDVERQQTKVWVVLGWSRKALVVDFDQRPQVQLHGPQAARPRIAFEGARYELLYPVTAEVYTRRLLNRAEWRELCDRHRSQKQILRALAQLE